MNEHDPQKNHNENLAYDDIYSNGQKLRQTTNKMFLRKKKKQL